MSVDGKSDNVISGSLLEELHRNLHAHYVELRQE